MIAFAKELYPELTKADFDKSIKPLLRVIDNYPEERHREFVAVPFSLEVELYPFHVLCKAIAASVFRAAWNVELDSLLADPQTFADACCEELAQLVSTYLMRPFSEDIKVRDPHQLRPAEGYQQYIRSTLENRFSEFSATYATGWSRCIRAARLRAKALSEVIKITEEHRKDLAEKLNIEEGVTIRHLSFSGDTHAYGRAVTIITFDNGQKVIFKPRSVSGEVGYAKLVDILREREIAGFRAMKALDLGDCGFTEYLKSRDHEPDFVAAGRLACLLYLMDAADMHYSNVFWTERGPIPIDLETLFHPARVRVGEPESPDSAHRILERSVYGTGILPRVVTSRQRSGSFDIGFVGNREMRGGNPFRNYEIVNPYTTDIRVVWRDEKHSIELDDDPSLRMKVDRACTQMEQGFIELFSRVLADKDNFVDAVLTAFDGARLRYIHNPTVQYAQILRTLGGAEPSRDRKLSSGLLSRVAILSVSAEPVIVEAECNQLWRGDIPYFCTSFGGTRVTADGTYVCELSKSPCELFRRKMTELNEDDMHNQLRILRLAFVAKLSDPHFNRRLTAEHGDEYVDEYIGDKPAIDAKYVLYRLARSLYERALDDRFEHLPKTWIGPVAQFGSREWSPGVLGYDLYSGREGPALALACAGSVLEDSALAKVASEVFDRSAAILTAKTYELRNVMASGTGGYSGVAGLLWSMHAAGRVTGNLSWQVAADRAWDIIDDNFGELTPDSFDMISGNTTSIIMRLRCTNRFPYNEAVVDRWVAAARNRMQADRDRITSGLAHGLAQVLWFFSEVASVRPTPELERLVMEVDRRICTDYLSADGLVQCYPQANRDTVSASWCNGQAGLLIAYTSAQTAGFRTRLTASDIVRQMRARPLPALPVLCHGGLGVMESLRTARMVAPEALALQSELENTLFTPHRLLTYFNKERGRYALSPGVMSGRAGAVLHLCTRVSSAHFPSVVDLTL
ncbi:MULTISPECIES: type 2 lanthipeptide synthetase LanM [unclassified Actinomyces]|uniref:type 2 lanthipeptide synthetase LanM n=1 Tax=unclassified Actinomyces TaxID=2609248 RepID=UPI000D594380|nr:MULTISPECIES: type 2 lanthipeptide synthetase LanM [unclassified Actinomyces]RAX22585.1 type 2 lantipeptide synthetase LanM [Actinomyces sp. Z3]